MKILAFLQNAWFPPAHIERVKALYARHGQDHERRAALTAKFLFYKSLTGKRLRTAFGEELCDRIIWAEASPELASKSSGCPPADLPYMRELLLHFKPEGLLVFGTPAQDALIQLQRFHPTILTGVSSYVPVIHPAARVPDVMARLKSAARTLTAFIALEEFHGAYKNRHPQQATPLAPAGGKAAVGGHSRRLRKRGPQGGGDGRTKGVE